MPFPFVRGRRCRSCSPGGWRPAHGRSRWAARTSPVRWDTCKPHASWPRRSAPASCPSRMSASSPSAPAARPRASRRDSKPKDSKHAVSWALCVSTPPWALRLVSLALARACARKVGAPLTPSSLRARLGIDTRFLQCAGCYGPRPPGGGRSDGDRARRGRSRSRPHLHGEGLRVGALARACPSAKNGSLLLAHPLERPHGGALALEGAPSVEALDPALLRAGRRSRRSKGAPLNGFGSLGELDPPRRAPEETSRRDLARRLADGYDRASSRRFDT